MTQSSLITGFNSHPSIHPSIHPSLYFNIPNCLFFNSSLLADKARKKIIHFSHSDWDLKLKTSISLGTLDQCPSIFLSIQPSVNPARHQSVCLLLFLSVLPSNGLAICLFVTVYVGPTIRQASCPSLSHLHPPPSKIISSIYLEQY